MYVAPDSTGGRFTHCLRALTLALVLLAASPFPASSAEGSETNGERLVRFFVDEFHPETMSMIIENEPEDDGLTKAAAAKRIASAVASMAATIGVSFTPPSEWEREPPDIREILNVHAFARITESDLNKNLLEKQFGDDDEWHNLQVRISPDGIYARGNYHVRVLFTLDILIEIFSKFKIVDMQQVWLDDYTLRVNRVDVPGFITDKAISQIQPLLDLGKFVFPLRLSSIVFEQGSMTIASRVIPEPFEGIVYEYTRDAEDVE